VGGLVTNINGGSSAGADVRPPRIRGRLKVDIGTVPLSFDERGEVETSANQVTFHFNPTELRESLKPEWKEADPSAGELPTSTYVGTKARVFSFVLLFTDWGREAVIPIEVGPPVPAGGVEALSRGAFFVPSPNVHSPEFRKGVLDVEESLQVLREFTKPRPIRGNQAQPEIGQPPVLRFMYLKEDALVILTRVEVRHVMLDPVTRRTIRAFAEVELREWSKSPQ